MGEDTKPQDNKPAAKSPEAIKASLLAQRKQAKISMFQSEYKKKLDAEEAAEKIVLDAQKVLISKQEESEEFVAEHLHLFQ